MAQSDVSRTISASARASASTPASASQSATRPTSAASRGRPSRHGTHLPHVCAAAACKSDRCTTTGHVPGGVAVTRRTYLSRVAAMRPSSFALGATDNLANDPPPLDSFPKHLRIIAERPRPRRRPHREPQTPREFRRAAAF